MGYNFLPCDREQLYLMPPALQDWLPEGDLAWFILDVVAQMDLGEMERTYRADGWGQAAYAPAMMFALLLYAYCLGERSSRRIERLCERDVAFDVAFMVLAAAQRPDHTTIARFRQTHETALARLLTQVLRRCAEAGLVKVGVVALDGTKLKANAALAANWTAEAMAQEVATMRREAAATDATEDRLYGADRRGDERPEPLRNRAGRLARLKACPKRLTRRERMERTLRTRRGRRLYRKRRQTVEPVFGQIKQVRGGDRFMRRGVRACDSEWKLLCGTHNLLKLWRSGKAVWAQGHRGRVQRSGSHGHDRKVRA